MLNSILVAVDGSVHSEKALKQAIDLAKKYDARLAIVHAHLHGRPVEEFSRMNEVEHMFEKTRNHFSGDRGTTKGSSLADLMENAEESYQVVTFLGDLILGSARDAATSSGLEKVMIHSRSGDYADGILDVAEDVCPDTIVIGHRGLGGVCI